MIRFVTLPRLGLSSFFAVSLALATGCGTEVQVGGSTGTGGDATSASTSTGSGGGANPSGGSVTSGGGGSPNPSTSGAGGGSGTQCGGFAGAACPPSEYCDFPDDLCGGADGAGTCKTRPGACDDNYIATCGCDGKIYPNECSAAGAGVDVSALGTCTPPAGTFQCGAHFCTAKAQYCQEDISDVGGVPNSFSCVALPVGCSGAGTCVCLAGVPCAQSCTATPDGHLKVTCPGG